MSMKIRRLNNVVLQTLSGLNYYELLATCSKYNIDASHVRKYCQADVMECVLSHCRYFNLMVCVF